MTRSTTTPAGDKMSGMSCDQIEAHGIAERYLVGDLDEPERDVYERHFFDCERCFQELTTVGALRTELNAAGVSAPGSWPVSERPWPAWLAAAAVIVLGVGLWTMRSAREAGPAPATGAVEPSASTQAPVAAAPAPSPVEPPAVSLGTLARFEPPRYTPPALRGPEDDARRLFAAAMTRYARGEHQLALNGLRVAADQDATAPDASFFLGVCLLLTGQPQAGITELKRTIALGDSPYLEEAHFYLAKGLLHVGDASAARRELQMMIALNGDYQREAKQLLSQVERVRPGR